MSDPVGEYQWRHQRDELTARILRLEQENDRLRQFIKDTSDEMECLPTCDSIMHDALCPVVNTAAAWRKLPEELADIRAKLSKIFQVTTTGYTTPTSNSA